MLSLGHCFMVVPTAPLSMLSDRSQNEVGTVLVTITNFCCRPKQNLYLLKGENQN